MRVPPSPALHPADLQQAALNQAALHLAECLFHRTALACFVAGTRIDTAQGPLAIETIQPGTLVRTADHGAQPVRRVLSKTVDGSGDLAPVCFAAGSMGNSRDLLVSPHHRMVVAGWQAQLVMAEDEVLVPAAALARGSDRAYRRPMAQVTYVHLLFDRHEIIFAEGAASESYHPLSHDADSLSPATQAELRALFPDLWASSPKARAARPCASAAEAALLAL